MDIAKRILELCANRNITPTRLADISDVPRSTIQDIIKRKNKNPRVNTVEKICLGLNITLSEFFSQEPLPKPVLPFEAEMEIRSFEQYIRSKYTKPK